MASSLRHGLAIAAALLVAGCSTRGDEAGLARLLATQDSATAVLQQVCAARAASPPAIVATPVAGRPAPLASADRALLGIGAGGQPGYRHVRLSCAGAVFSEAHNWYVPARLTPEMRRQLAETDRPFGAVAAPLHFRRVRLGSLAGRQSPCPRGTVLTERGLLRLADGAPLALVVECYTRAAAGSAGSEPS